MVELLDGFVLNLDIGAHTVANSRQKSRTCRSIPAERFDERVVPHGLAAQHEDIGRAVRVEVDKGHTIREVATLRLVRLGDRGDDAAGQRRRAKE